MTWKYHTMMYADRYPIQFRQDVVSRRDSDCSVDDSEWKRQTAIPTSPS